jgi:hypothetical protein
MLYAELSRNMRIGTAWSDLIGQGKTHSHRSGSRVDPWQAEVRTRLSDRVGTQWIKSVGAGALGTTPVSGNFGFAHTVEHGYTMLHPQE